MWEEAVDYFWENAIVDGEPLSWDDTDVTTMVSKPREISTMFTADFVEMALSTANFGEGVEVLINDDFLSSGEKLLSMEKRINDAKLNMFRDAPTTLHKGHTDAMDCELVGFDPFSSWYTDYYDGPLYAFKTYCVWYDEDGNVTYDEYYDDNFEWAFEELILNELEVHVGRPLEEILEDWADEVADYVYDALDIMEDQLEDAFEDDVEDMEDWIDESLPDVLDWLESSLQRFGEIVEDQVRNITEKVIEDVEDFVDDVVEDFVDEAKNDIEQAVNNTAEILEDSLNDLAGDVQAIGEEIVDGVEEVVSDITNWIDEVKSDILVKEPRRMVNTAAPQAKKESHTGYYLMAAGATMLVLAAGVAVTMQKKKREEHAYNERLLSAYVDDETA